MQEQPFVSIIVPVFNDAERLAKCLEVLETQTYPKTRYEVIVVDNGSCDDPAAVVARFSQGIATYEGRPGSYAARNQGLSLARGEVIAFTDSDCIPAPDWIAKGVDALAAIPHCGLVAGRVEVFCRNSEAPNAVELYTRLMTLQQRWYVDRARFGATANVFTYRQVIDDVGGFDARLKSGGDREWGRRVTAAGYEATYAEDARVAHPALSTLASLYRKQVRLAGGMHDLTRVTSSSFWRLLLRELTMPIRHIGPIFSSKRLTAKQRGQLLVITFFVGATRSWEIIRLSLGGRSVR